jgi:predicted cobalt transporter CbtA
MLCLLLDTMSAAEKEIEAVSSNDHSLSDPEKNAEAKQAQQQGEENEDTTEHLSGVRLGLIVLGLCLAVLLVGLVSTFHRRRSWSLTEIRTTRS